MRRMFLALAVPAMVSTGLTVALPAASAFSATPKVVSCTHFSGSVTSSSEVSHASGCNQTTITGGAGKQKAPLTGMTFSIKWTSGKTSKGTYTSSSVTPSTCPASFPVEDQIIETVTGGTATPLVGGSGSSLLCVNTSMGTYEILPGTKYKV